MRFRFFLLMVGMVLVFLAVVVQAYRIQIRHGTDLRKEAEEIYRKRIAKFPTRGSIFDRNGDVLAISYPVNSVYARPREVKDPAAASRILSGPLNLPPRRILKKLQRRNSSFVWLKRQVIPPVSEKILELRLPGIHVAQESRRFYPNLELACHLLGFVGVDGKGLEGLEFQYDRVLHGEKTYILRDVDALNRPLAPVQGILDSERDGNHLVLTIHKQIQHVVETHLKRAVKDHSARAAMAVVLDPKTGEILAMANVPGFNPNVFSQFPRSAMRNRCVTDAYEPGSTFKTFLLAAALEEGLFKPDQILFCENGTFRVYDRIIHDVKRHGWLTLQGILQRSSNIGAAKVGLQLGPKRFYRYLKGFGFGRPTEVDLPGEASGVVRPPERWSPVDLATISFGQGISATALQLAVAYGSIANRGVRMRPFLVKEILDPHGQTIRRVAPKEVGRVISPQTAQTLTRMLTSVVSEKGTGARAALEGFRVAGKTGTAQKPDLRAGGYRKDRYTASFAGFVPAEDPRICLVVLVDEPKEEIYGGQVAAPLFREIARDVLGILGVYADRRLLAQGPGLPGGEP